MCSERRPAPDPPANAAAIGLAGFLTVTGTTHFVVPRPYDAIVPRRLPGRRRAWTYVSGMAELATAALVAVPRTRRVGGLVAAGLFVAVFPANVKMAVDWARQPRRSPLQRLVAWMRLPLQVPLVTWAVRVWRTG